jgi:hypothetical protein
MPDGEAEAAQRLAHGVVGSLGARGTPALAPDRGSSVQRAHQVTPAMLQS